jgi:predicted signal transduction protein with EAL and GGDEF domain
MIHSNDDVAIFARRVVNYLSRPYLVDQHSLNIGASVGIAIGREHASDAETLLQYADMALYRVKADTRGDYKFFEAYMDKEAQEKRVIELDLRHAIARKELEVHFQPQIKIATGKFTGAEALVRWRHPTRGFVSPEIFIRVAEETGMIVEIGEWVLRESCLAAKAWPNDMRVAVNLSAVQFHAGNLVQTVRKVLNETGFPAQRLELEITESLLMSDKDRNGAIMRELNEMGIRISLDDFGKGFSSLSYLKDYTFDKIKVDKDFVDQIGINPKAEAIIRAVACLGLDMQMSITVEGVESAEQVKVVTDLGCTDIQGWYYSKALPQQALLDFLTKDAASRRPNALAA